MPAWKRLAIVGLLFVSGATGLAYELTWSKRLSNLLGNSGQAHACVLAAFMGGLALGAFLFGRVADRVKAPLRLYGLLEVGVGLYALIFPHLLDALTGVYLAVAPGLEGAPRTVVKLLCAALALVPPTLLMGGTLPAVTRSLGDDVEAARKDLPVLYAANTLGAAAGVLLIGLLFMPTLGLSSSERLAAVGNLVLGGLAIAVARRLPQRGGAPAVTTAPEVAAPREGAPASAGGSVETAQPPAFEVSPKLTGIAAGLTGFTTMLLEITWIRLLAIVLGGTTYAFTFILATFILGMGIGSLWLSRRPQTGRGLEPLAWLQSVLVLSLCVTLPLYAYLPFAMHHVQAGLVRSAETWPVFLSLSALMCCSVLLVPTFLIGASFPAIGRVAMTQRASLGGQLGGVYLWNTVGSVLGSLLGGLVLLPTIGLEGNLALGLGLSLVCAGLGVAGTPRDEDDSGRPARLLLAGAAVLTLINVVGAGNWGTLAAAAGRMRDYTRPLGFSEFRGVLKLEKTLRYAKDDVAASVLVRESAEGHKALVINGKTDASNGGDITTQAMLGHMGILLHQGPVKRVLVIGAGSGVTAASVLKHPVERVDLIEISPGVLEAMRFFAKENGEVWKDPRLHLVLDDAKSFLQLEREPYDLIISEPSNPWVSGVAGLFTQDFFQLASSKLAPHGRLVQWLHAYESNERMMRLVVRTLRETFKQGSTWLGPEDLLLVAAQEPVVADPKRFAECLAVEAVQRDLGALHLASVDGLLALQLQDEALQREWGGTGPLNTDDLNLLEFGAAEGFFIGELVKVPDLRRRPGPLAIDRLSLSQVREVYASLASFYPLHDPIVRSLAAGWLSKEPDSVDAALALARSQLAQREGGAAIEVLEPKLEALAAQRSPEGAALWLEAVTLQEKRHKSMLLSSRLPQALALAEAALAAHPEHARLKQAIEGSAAAK